MKRLLLLTCLLIVILHTPLSAQVPGDTIEIRAFNYNSGTRDTMIQFPDDPSLQFEKIILHYNMRCKDGLVSAGVPGQTNIGCGEWDYSCNTYITDSTKTDSIFAFHPSHVVSSFSGTAFNYVADPLYDFYQFEQPVASTSVTGELLHPLGASTTSVSSALATDQHSARSQYLFTASELLAAGMSAGDIGALEMDANNNAYAGFLRVRIKHTSATSLTAGEADTTGFEEVYFQNSSLNAGLNRLDFYQTFNWDGSSNLLIEFIQTNATTGLNAEIQGDLSGSSASLHANENYYISTAAGGVVNLSDANTASVSNEITVSYWCRGAAGAATTNTTTTEARDDAFNRQVNIHHPWSNSRIYWDCGNDGSGYDRIDKLATSAELENTWNHWAFTKNTATGVMRIYKNGVLWHSGTGKTKPIQIDSMILGSSALFTYTYPGDMDEFRIWDKELSASEIMDWMNRSIDPSHPSYPNLVAYYPMNEAAGSVLNDLAPSGVAANFVNPPAWKYLRGEEVVRFFTASDYRPAITLAQGSYLISTTSVTVLDSVQVLPNAVTEYTIIPSSGLNDDLVSPISFSTLWEANAEKIYDGLSGTVLSTSPVTADGIINISDLTYTRRFPSKFEIMSFVTPYGINLDMGMEGETWLFDITDFAPVLRGSKRLNMQAGGQWQEDMDIRFMFIVGTPPRDVLDIQQIWKSDSQRGYGDILSDRYFEPRNINLRSDGEYFKIRTSITGHGAEGEFISRNHWLNLDGGSIDFAWPVWKECALNPVYPQGGTWIYDRAGWCPGMATDIRENDITDVVTAGGTVEIDYGLNSASGDSRYYVNNQLVTYGAANHTLDASVIEVRAPSRRIEYDRTSTICQTPIILIRNTGSQTLTSADIEYWVEDDPEPWVFEWTGNLDFMEETLVYLPTDPTFWTYVEGEQGTFHARITKPNGGTDEYSYNDQISSAFDIPNVLPTSFVVWLTTNSAGNETSYRVMDDENNIVFEKSGLANTTVYKDTITLGPGCYTLTLSDTDDDGIDFWANSDGFGSFRMRDALTNAWLAVFEGDFGRSVTYPFTVEFALAHAEPSEIAVNVYPNPASDYVLVQGDLEGAVIRVSDLSGRQMQLPARPLGNATQLNTSNLASGIYLLQVEKGDFQKTVKLVIE